MFYLSGLWVNVSRVEHQNVYFVEFRNMHWFKRLSGIREIQVLVSSQAERFSACLPAVTQRSTVSVTVGGVTDSCSRNVVVIIQAFQLDNNKHLPPQKNTSSPYNNQ